MSETARTYFQNHRFAGAVSNFKDFSQELSDVIMETLGGEGIAFLFTNWPIRVNQVNDGIARYDLGEKFTPKEVPKTLAGVDYEIIVDESTGELGRVLVTEEMRTRREVEIVFAKLFNDRIANVHRRCQRILSERSCDQLNVKYAIWNHPVTAWRFLLDQHGPKESQLIGVRGSYSELLYMVMRSPDRFKRFIRTYDDLVREVGASNDMARRVLLCDEEDANGRYRTLPQRLSVAVRICKELKKTYLASVAYITEVDESQHLEGKCVEIEALTKIDPIIELTCMNCSNTGHDARTCLSDMCSYCQRRTLFFPTPARN